MVLLSGGLDSATALAIARAEGFETHALTVFYGQRHAAEIDAAEVEVLTKKSLQVQRVTNCDVKTACAISRST